MFLEHFQNSYQQTLHPEGSLFFTPNGCNGARLKTNLSHINAMFADWDFKPKEGEPTGSAKPDFKQFMLDLDDLPTPTFVVESGNGWHLYWCLEESLIVDDSNREKLISHVEGVHRYIHTNYGSDSGAMDVLRLMRVPGHEHRKQPEHPFMVRVVVDNSDTKYKLYELLEAMPPVYKEVVEVDESDDEDDYSVRQAAIDAWAERGDKVEFDTFGRMVWNGQKTGTFIGRQGKQNYIATTSEEFPYRGNPTTYVAGVLDITTKEAYKWLIGKYGEPKSTEELSSTEELVSIDERDAYREHLAEKKWGDKDWEKKLKQLGERYVANFYKYLSIKYPHLLFEVGEDKSYWNYNKETGVYDGVNFSTVRGVVAQLMIDEGFDAVVTETTVKNVLLKYRAVYIERGVTFDSFVSHEDYFHVANGWLNTKTRELTPHTPERLSLYKSKVSYNPTAVGETYNKMLDEQYQLPKDAVRVIDQFSGYILTHRVDQQKILVFEGRPGCGKSTLPRIWLDLLGEKATTASLPSLSNSEVRFMGGNFVNKNFCFFDEANPKTENINEYFMSMADQKTIRVERKGIQGVGTPRYTMKVVLSLNKMPYHQPEGFKRRYRHILFERSFTDEGVEDTEILEKVTESDDEMSAVLNRMLDGLDDLRKMRKFTMIAGEEDRKRAHTIAADTMSEFLDTYFEPVYDNEVRFTFQQLKESYQELFPTSFNRGLSTAGFNKELLNPRLPEFKHIKDGRKSGYRGYTGLNLKQGYSLGRISKGNNVEMHTILVNVHQLPDSEF